VPEPIIFVDTFQIREGKLEDFKRAAKEMTELVEENESQLLVYNIYIDEAGSRMTGVQMHPDSASVEKHFAVAGPHFGKVMECLESGGTMHAYGSPSEQVRRQMTQMAASMGVTVTFTDLFAGFAR
jgi:quinol monooxygenase YgiN